MQFHWHNSGYRDYDHFLESSPRDNARTLGANAGASSRRVTCETLLGPGLDGAAIDEVYDLHRDTFLRHGHEPYLTRAFFRAMPKALGEHFMVKRARHRRRNRGGRGFFWSPEALYGRYWGANAQFHSLHFEPCYHQGIEFCIERGIAASNPARRANTR